MLKDTPTHMKIIDTILKAYSFSPRYFQAKTVLKIIVRPEVMAKMLKSAIVKATAVKI